LLIKIGALRLPADGNLNLGAQITRGQAIEILGRALLDRLRGSALIATSSKSQISNLKPDIGDISLGTAAGVDRGRLVLTTPAPTRDGTMVASNPSRYVTVEASNTRTGRARQEDGSASPPVTKGSSQGPGNPGGSAGLEVEADAWLFRNLAGESYQVNRLALIGGERVVYHVGSGGRVDFIEVTPSDKSAATDRFSRVASWQERLSADEVGARLARARAGVGQPQSIKPVKLNDSGRVAEIEIVGTDGTSTLRGGQIKSALGMRETLFVVDTEIDSRGKVTGFVFTGRGWGHGVGLCQTGAYGLAKQGYSYKAILQKYYTGIRVQKAY
jgi:hypothetical protein